MDSIKMKQVLWNIDFPGKLERNKYQLSAVRIRTEQTKMNKKLTGSLHAIVRYVYDSHLNSLVVLIWGSCLYACKIGKIEIAV